MKQFDVYVQNQFYKTISAKNTGDALTVVANDLRKGLVSHFNSSKDHEIKIVSK